MRPRLPWFLVTLCLVALPGGVLAQSNPFDGLDARGRALLDPELYAKQKAQWLARLQILPDNVDVLEGAADFFMIRERSLSQQFIERARTLEPNDPRWPRKLAQIHKMNAAALDDPAEARLALAELERAEALTPAEKRGLPTPLAQAAFDAADFAKARTYAERLLAESSSKPRSWDYGNAVHKGHIVLGRLALREGRRLEAISHLRAAGATPGSPQLDSFGPNMTLARELLEAGETDAVLEYFEQCRAFWKMGGDKLADWTALVKGGRTPNFGANLQY